jgi:hypothetical protein
VAGIARANFRDAAGKESTADRDHESERATVSIGALEGAWPGSGGAVRAAGPHLVWRVCFARACRCRCWSEKTW